jgi:hypothetical protein
LPQDNPTRSAGRDEQCELFVAAICAKAGLRPTFDEPDIRCHFRDETIAVAVKRIKSLEAFEKHIKKAASQIDRTGLRGVIAVDLTVGLNPDNEPFVQCLSDEQYGVAARAAVGEFLSSQFLRIASWTEGTGVRGLIVIHHDIRQNPAGGWSVETFNLSTHLSPHNQKRRRDFDALAREFLKGMPTHPASA